MALENEIKSAGEVATSLTKSERGTFLAIMITALISIVFLVVYFLNSINHIVQDHNKALSESHKDYLDAQKIRDAEFVQAIYGNKGIH